jgi:ketosteroid isomerase-like protein
MRPRWAQKGNSMTTEKTLELVRAYYDSWKQGETRYDEPRLREVLHSKVVFESPVGRKETLDDFLPGLQRFAKTVKGFTMLQLLGSGTEAAAIYDCALTAPVERLRCAEVFRVEGEQIVSIRLVFDATPYKLPPA